MLRLADLDCLIWAAKEMGIKRGKRRAAKTTGREGGGEKDKRDEEGRREEGREGL